MNLAGPDSTIKTKQQTASMCNGTNRTYGTKLEYENKVSFTKLIYSMLCFKHFDLI